MSGFGRYSSPVDVAEKTRALGHVLAFNPLKAQDWINIFGKFALYGVYLMIFAETGLFFGFFLPGDSLLFIAGVAASPVADRVAGTHIPIVPLLIGVPIMAIVGAQFGHFLGARYGRKLFDRPDSRIFKRQYVERAEHYFNKYGPVKAVLLARFIPIIRTFLNPVAGILEMPARKFLLWNIIGGLIWTEAVLIFGWKMAGVIPAEVIDTYMLPVVAVIVLISLIPVFLEIIRGLRGHRQGRDAPATSADTDPNGADAGQPTVRR